MGSPAILAAKQFEDALRTIAVISLKGGSGKTTIATHLALAAFRRGESILLADTDPQRSSTDVLSIRAEPGPAVITTTGQRLMQVKFQAVAEGRQLLIIDTAAGAVEDVGEALVLADFAVMVVRPTLLDLAGLARTISIVRRLNKPYTVVLNQAPIARENVEPPVVKRAIKGLEYMQVPIAPVFIRNRAIYQTALETGRSAEEMNDATAAAEIAELWDFVDASLDALNDDDDEAQA
ncbi:MAG: AAA family ATPase [Caulobacteraceae bacterium]